MSPSRPSRIPFHLFIVSVSVLGMAVFASALMSWESKDPVRGYFFLLLTLVVSGFKFNLPHLAGTLSVNFVFILLGILELSFGEAVMMGCISSAVQVYVHKHKTGIRIPAVFHVANTAIAVTLAYRVYHAPWLHQTQQSTLVAMAVAAAVLFVMNTIPAAAAVSLARHSSFMQLWRECNFRVFPLYLAGSTLAAMFHYSTQVVGPESAVLLLPAAFIIYCSYHASTGRLHAEKNEVEELAALHMRTIEALAMAIEAKDTSARNHIQRLQLYCAEIGKELNLSDTEMGALRAAAVLHDIGNLAVPDHILSKSGKLTREEFEKVKIHPAVGADILERVNFPFPVARIVRAHHEKWNGGGYPNGLKGDTIPAGARILAAVDCFDALISDRPYRPAMSLSAAIQRLAMESGSSFDPKIIRILIDKHEELENRMAIEYRDAGPALARDVVLDAAPAPGQEQRASGTITESQGGLGFLDTIAAARHEEHVLLELTRELGTSLHLDESLASLTAGLRRLLPFDSLVVYVVHDEQILPRFASGEATSMFLSRPLSPGQGIAGWVAAHGRPILNGNPSLEIGIPAGSHRTRLLNSALAVPLPAPGGAGGVLMLCRRGFDAFSKDDQRVLQALSPKLGAALENARNYEKVAAFASTDFLTGLPNARALQARFEGEIGRCRRLGGSLTVLVCDLDGFKEINDRHGHAEGDNVLREVAKALRQGCRDYDFVARMGGDEFVILLPSLPEEDTAVKIDQLGQAVSEAARTVVPDCSLTLSVGQARFPHHGDKAEALLAEADQRMYEVKLRRKKGENGSSSRGFDFDAMGGSASVQ